MKSLAMAVLCICLFSLCVQAADKPYKSEQRKAAVSAVSNKDYYRKDSVTGKINLPPKDYQQQLEALNLTHSDEGLVKEVMADGSIRINLQGRFMMHSSMINKDGKVEYICSGHSKNIHQSIVAPKRAVR